MDIGAMGDNSSEKKLQALVPESVAESFQATCKALGLTQEKAFGQLATLFVRLPRSQQLTLAIALGDSEAFGAFMAAVNRVIGEAIMGRLTSLQDILLPAVAEFLQSDTGAALIAEAVVAQRTEAHVRKSRQRRDQSQKDAG